MNESLQNVKACVFDAYGTLFDFVSAASKFREQFADKFVPFTTTWRDKQLQYTWLRSLQGKHADFWQVTGDALDYSLATCEISDANGSLREQLMQQYLALEVFPEVPETLKKLKESGIKTAILSNGTADMLDQVVSTAGIGQWLDEILSIDTVGIFKPHPSVYQLAVDKLGIKAEEISFQSSNSWDAYAASAFGMKVVWCNRYGQQPERLPGKPDAVVKSLEELPALLSG